MGYLDGSIPQPPSTNASASLQWKQIDQLLVSWLFSTISEDVLPEVVGLSTAKEEWDTLNQMFIQHHRMREIELRQKIQSCCKGTASMSHYIKQFKNLCDELDAIEKLLNDDDKVSWILKGLDRNYNVVLTNIHTRKNYPTFKEVLPVLLAQEALLQSYDDNIQPEHQTAYFTQRGGHQPFSHGPGCGRSRFRGGRSQGHG